MLDIVFRIILLVGISLFVGILILISPVYSALIVVLFVIALFFISKNNCMYYLILFLVPIDRFYLPVFYKLKYYQIVFIGAIIIGLITTLIKRDKLFSFKWNIIDVSILSIYVARVLSLIVTIDAMTSIKALLLYGLFVLLYFYIRQQTSIITPTESINYMLTVSIFYIGFGFIEFILGKLGIIAIQTADSIYVYGGRPSSVFREPDWFGGYLTFIIGLTMALFAYKKTNKEKTVSKVIFYSALFMSFLIVVRSSWLGIMAGALFVIIFSKKARKIMLLSITKMVPVVIIIVSLLAIFAFQNFRSIQDRFISTFVLREHGEYDAAAQVRLNSYEIILDYIKEEPIKGYGVGGWEYLSQRHKYVNPSLSTNNVLLTSIFEMGLIGEILLLLFIYSLFKLIRIGIKYANTEIEQRYAIGITISVIGSMVVSIFNDIMLTGFYWVFIALFNNYVFALKDKYENIARS